MKEIFRCASASNEYRSKWTCIIEKNLSKIRIDKMKAQFGLCYCCQQPMWSDRPCEFGERYGLSPKQVTVLQCTAEHLLAKSDGGLDEVDNIVAACLYCNNRRYRSRKPRSPDRHAERVRHRLAMGKWHGFVSA